jgi:hypothetical protein
MRRANRGWKAKLRDKRTVHVHDTNTDRTQQKKKQKKEKKGKKKQKKKKKRGITYP